MTEHGQIIQGIGSDINLGAIAGDVFFWLIIILFVIALALIIGWGTAFVYRLMKYKIKIEIYHQQGPDSFRPVEDLGMEVTNDKTGRTELRILKAKRTIAMPPGKFLMPMGMRSKLNLAKIGGELIPMQVTTNSPVTFELNLEKLSNAISWREKSRESAVEAYYGKESFFSKYGAVLMNATLMIMMFVLFFILIHQMQSGITIRAILDTSQQVIQQG